MRHLNKKKFGESKDNRRKVLRALASSIIVHERVVTTLSLSRAVRPYLEKLITRSKESNLHNRRLLLSLVTSRATAKLLEVLGPKYKDRKGGYLRLTKLVSSNAPRSQILIEFVD